MKKNEHGIEVNEMQGRTIVKALYKGKTSFLFLLIADYLRSNGLKVPREIITLYKTENLYECPNDEEILKNRTAG